MNNQMKLFALWLVAEGCGRRFARNSCAVRVCGSGPVLVAAPLPTIMFPEEARCIMPSGVEGAVRSRGDGPKQQGGRSWHRCCMYVVRSFEPPWEEAKKEDAWGPLRQRCMPRTLLVLVVTVCRGRCFKCNWPGLR